jgi:predicted acylesterase/phospholipase RssA
MRRLVCTTFISLIVSALVAALTSTAAPRLLKSRQPVDVILSSGFLAFARQAGVLAAIEDFKIDVDRLVGTSSGSLGTSLFAAGLSAEQIAFELGKQRPISLVQPSVKVHRGAFSLNKMVAHLRTILPKDFNQLERKLGEQLLQNINLRKAYAYCVFRTITRSNVNFDHLQR